MRRAIATALCLMALTVAAQEMEGLGSGLKGGGVITSPKGVEAWVDQPHDGRGSVRTPDGDIYWIEQNEDGSGTITNPDGDIYWYSGG